MPEHVLQDRIADASRRLQRVARGTAWLRAGSLLVLAFAATCLLDLLAALPAILRVAVGVILLTGCGIAIIAGPFAARAVRRRPAEFFADALEHASRKDSQPADSGFHPILNAVQFSHALAAADVGPASVSLMRAEIERGARAAGRVARCATDLRPARRHALVLGVALASLLLSGLIRPDVLAAVAVRLIDPLGDHPPFCPTGFAVHYEPLSADGLICIGDSANVVVNLSGSATPDVVWLEREPSGSSGAVARIELSRRTATEWSARLDRIVSDVVFRVHVPGGYSRLHRLVPSPVPRIVETLVRYAPPAWTERETTEIPLGADGIREMRGTTITLLLRSNRALSGGVLRLHDEDNAERIITMAPIEAGFVRDCVQAAFTLDQDGRLAAYVQSADGINSADRVETTIHAWEPPPSQARPGIPDTQAKRDAGAKAAADDAHLPVRDGDGERRGTTNGTHARGGNGTGPGFSASPSNGPPVRSAAPFAMPKDPLAPPTSRTAFEAMPRPKAPAADDGPISGEQAPARYRELTEAYFRRLAEEGR